MLSLPASVRVYLAIEPVDLRRGHDGLCALVRETYALDPHEGHLFAFVGRRGDRVKVLYWERGGFVVRPRFRVGDRVTLKSPYRAKYRSGVVSEVLPQDLLALALDGYKDTAWVAVPIEVGSWRPATAAERTAARADLAARGTTPIPATKGGSST